MHQVQSGAEGSVSHPIPLEGAKLQGRSVCRIKQFQTFLGKKEKKSLLPGYDPFESETFPEVGPGSPIEKYRGRILKIPSEEARKRRDSFDVEGQ